MLGFMRFVALVVFVVVLLGIGYDRVENCGFSVGSLRCEVVNREFSLVEVGGGGERGGSKLTIESEMTHWILSRVTLEELEPLILELEQTIERLTEEFRGLKASSRKVRENYDSHECRLNKDERKQRGNRCERCEKRANAIKRLQLNMKSLSKSIIGFQFKLDKCKYRQKILQGKEVQKEVMYRPFSSPYVKRTSEKRADLQRRRQEKRRARASQMLGESEGSGRVMSRHEMELKSYGERSFDEGSLAVVYFQPKSLVYFTVKLLASISQLLEILMGFHIQMCLDDVFQIRVEKIQKTLKSHYAQKSRKYQQLLKEREEQYGSDGGKVDEFLQEKIRILKTTLSVLNRSILFAQVVQMLCIYDVSTNSFVSARLPTVCESLSLKMIESELSSSSIFRGVSVKQLKELYEGDLRSSSTVRFQRFKGMNDRILLALRFIYKKCIELKWTVERQDLDLGYTGRLLPDMVRFPVEYYDRFTGVPVLELVEWLFGSSRDVNLLERLSASRVLVLLDRLIDMMSTYKHMMLKRRDLRAGRLLLGTNQVLSILILGMIRSEEIVVPFKSKMETEMKMTNSKSLDELLERDRALGETSGGCSQYVLSLYYFRYLQLELIKRRIEQGGDSDKEGSAGISSLLKRLEKMIESCRSGLRRDPLVLTDLDGLSGAESIHHLTMGLISSYYIEAPDLLSEKIAGVGSFFYKLLDKIMSMNTQSALMVEKVDCFDWSICVLLDNKMIRTEKHIFSARFLELLLELYNIEMEHSGRSIPIEIKTPKYISTEINRFSTLSGGFLPPLSDVSSIDDSSYFDSEEESTKETSRPDADAAKGGEEKPKVPEQLSSSSTRAPPPPSPPSAKDKDGREEGVAEAPVAPPPSAKVEAPVTPPSAKVEAPVAPPPSAKVEAPVAPPPSAKAEAPVAPPPSAKAEAPVAPPPSAKAEAPVTPPSAKVEAPVTPPSAKAEAPVAPPPSAKAEAPVAPPPSAKEEERPKRRPEMTEQLKQILMEIRSKASTPTSTSSLSGRGDGSREGEQESVPKQTLKVSIETFKLSGVHIAELQQLRDKMEGIGLLSPMFGKYLSEFLWENQIQDLTGVECSTDLVTQLEYLRIQILESSSKFQHISQQLPQASSDDFIVSQSSHDKNQEIQEYLSILALLDLLGKYVSQIIQFCFDGFKFKPKLPENWHEYSVKVQTCDHERYTPLVDLSKFLMTHLKKNVFSSNYSARMLNYLMAELGGFNEFRHCLDDEKLTKWRLLKAKCQSSLESELGQRLSDPAEGGPVENYQRFLSGERVKVYQLVLELLKELIGTCESLRANPSDLRQKSQQEVFKSHCKYKYSTESALERFGLFKNLSSQQKTHVLVQLKNLMFTYRGLSIIHDSNDCDLETIVHLFGFYSKLSAIRDLYKSDGNLFEIPNAQETKVLNLKSIKFLLKLATDMISFCLTYSPLSQGQHSLVPALIDTFANLRGLTQSNFYLRNQSKELSQILLLLRERFIYSSLDCNLKSMITIIQERNRSRDLLRFYRDGPSNERSERIDQALRRREHLFQTSSSIYYLSDQTNLKSSILVEETHLQALDHTIKSCMKVVQSGWVRLDQGVAMWRGFSAKGDSLASSFYHLMGGFDNGLLSEEIILLLSLLSSHDLRVVASLMEKLSFNMSGLKDCSHQKVQILQNMAKKMWTMRSNLSARMSSHRFEEIFSGLPLNSELMITKIIHSRLESSLDTLILLLEDILERCKTVLQSISDVEMMEMSRLPSISYFSEFIREGLMLGDEQITTVFLEQIRDFDLFGHILSCLESNYIRLRAKYHDLQTDYSKRLASFLGKESSYYESSDKMSAKHKHFGFHHGCKRCHYFSKLKTLIGYSMALDYFGRGIFACLDRAEKHSGLGVIRGYLPELGEKRWSIPKIVKVITAQSGEGVESLEAFKASQAGKSYAGLIMEDKVGPELCTGEYLDKVVSVLEEMDMIRSSISLNSEELQAHNHYIPLLMDLYRGLVKYCFRFGILVFYRSIESREEPRFKISDWESHKSLVDLVFPSFPLSGGFMTNYQLFGFDFLQGAGDYSMLFDLKTGMLLSRESIGGDPFSDLEWLVTAGEERRKETEYPMDVEVIGEAEKDIIEHLKMGWLLQYDLVAHLESLSGEMSDLLFPRVVKSALSYIQGCDLRLLEMLNRRISTLKELQRRLGKDKARRKNTAGGGILSNLLASLMDEVKSCLARCRDLNKYRSPWLNISELKGERSLIQELTYPLFANSERIPMICAEINLEDAEQFVRMLKLRLGRLDGEGKTKKERSAVKAAIRRNSQLVEICKEILKLRAENSEFYHKILETLVNLEFYLKVGKEDVDRFTENMSNYFKKAQMESKGEDGDEDEEVNTLYGLYLSLAGDSPLSLDDFSSLAAAEGVGLSEYLQRSISMLSSNLPTKEEKDTDTGTDLMETLMKDKEVNDAFSIYNSLYSNAYSLTDLIIFSDFDKFVLLELINKLIQNFETESDTSADSEKELNKEKEEEEKAGAQAKASKEEGAEVNVLLKYGHLLNDFDIIEKYLIYLQTVIPPNNPLDLIDFIMIPGNDNKKSLLLTLGEAIKQSNPSLLDIQSLKLEEEKRKEKEIKDTEAAGESKPKSPEKKERKKEDEKKEKEKEKKDDSQSKPKSPKSPKLPKFSILTKPTSKGKSPLDLMDDTEVVSLYHQYSKIEGSPLDLQDLVFSMDADKDKLIEFLKDVVSSKKFSPKKQQPQNDSISINSRGNLTINVDKKLISVKLINAYTSRLKNGCPAELLNRLKTLYDVSLAETTHISTLYQFLKSTKCLNNRAPTSGDSRLIKKPCNDCFVCKSNARIGTNQASLQKIVLAIKTLIEFCQKHPRN
ncbi:hypothetical protein OJ253_1909 [Cryptosporidium canis]|uniref:Uncharacterized protein n=1 Tax=Cryptosporidium canis TaxID=195482 RepID=A0A9D5DKA8_9CRYT|nr:hypothetical protein OJ253_1909 [Cryptosporidium canis]